MTQVSVHLSLEAVPKDAETLKESLYDGSLRPPHVEKHLQNFIICTLCVLGAGA